MKKIHTQTCREVVGGGGSKYILSQLFSAKKTRIQNGKVCGL